MEILCGKKKKKKKETSAVKYNTSGHYVGGGIIRAGYRPFLVDQRYTNNNVEMADQISLKFSVDIIFRTGSSLIIQTHSPGGANSTITGESRWAVPCM